jgi:hypothetical protein
MRTPAFIPLLAAAGGLALACVGCGGASSTRTVASLSGHAVSGSAAGAALSSNQMDAAMVHFTHCMRAAGVQMSDPYHRPGHQGLSIAFPPRTAATAAAWHTCNHFIQPLVEMKMRGQQAIAGPEIPALTRYAECMRAHDIDMLDPTSFGALNLGRVAGITDNWGRYSPQFRTADVACRHLLPAGVHDDGTGP